MPRLEFHYPILPPTENHIRQIRFMRNPRTGKSMAQGMCYTPDAERYKREFSEWVRVNHFVDVQKFRRQFSHGMVFSLSMVFFFPPTSVMNKGWLKNGKSKSKTPYKRMDVGNRRKLLEDCLSEAIDIDDSLFFELSLVKVASTDIEGVRLRLESEPEDLYGIPEEYHHGPRS